MLLIEKSWNVTNLTTGIFVKHALVHSVFKLLTMLIVSIGISSGSGLTYLCTMIGLLFSVEMDVFIFTVRLEGTFAWEHWGVSIMHVFFYSGLAMMIGIASYRFGRVLGFCVGLGADASLIGVYRYVLIATKFGNSTPVLVAALFAVLIICLAMGMYYTCVALPEKGRPKPAPTVAAISVPTREPVSSPVIVVV